MSVNGSSNFALNFRCFSGESGLTPRITASSPSNRGKASRKEHASIVHPGVSSIGEKYKTTGRPLKSLSETRLPRSSKAEKYDALSLPIRLFVTLRISLHSFLDSL